MACMMREKIPAIKLYEDLRDDELFDLATAAAREHAEAWGDSAFTCFPAREDHAVVMRIDGRVVAFATWVEWEHKAYIREAWVRPDLRRHGFYRSMVEAIGSDAVRRGLKQVSACVAGRNLVSCAVHERIFGEQDQVYFEMPAGTPRV